MLRVSAPEPGDEAAGAVFSVLGPLSPALSPPHTPGYQEPVLVSFLLWPKLNSLLALKEGVQGPRQKEGSLQAPLPVGSQGRLSTQAAALKLPAVLALDRASGGRGPRQERKGLPPSVAWRNPEEGRIPLKTGVKGASAHRPGWRSREMLCARESLREGERHSHVEHLLCGAGL